jgi:hypothetical protein
MPRGVPKWRDSPVSLLHLIIGVALVTLVFCVLWMLLELDRCYRVEGAMGNLVKCEAQTLLRTDTSMGWDCTCTVEGSTAACACDRRSP